MISEINPKKGEEISMKSKDSMKEYFGNSNVKSLKAVGNGIVIGILAGLVAVLYRFLLGKGEVLLHYMGSWSKQSIFHGICWFVILGMISFVVAKLIKWEPMISGSGIPQISGEVKGYLNPSWWKILIAKIIGGTLCIIGGLSLGREGPSVQLGGMAGKGYAKATKQDETKEKQFISCGASAGLSAAFNAPLSGLMFSLEEIHKNFSSSVLVTTLIATVVADFVSKTVFGLNTVFGFELEKVLPLSHYPLLVLLGAILGMCGVIYNKVTLEIQSLYKKIPASKMELRVIIPFFIAGVLGFLCPQVLAGGHTMIELLEEKPGLLVLIFLLLLKFIFSAVCFGSGAPGGIFFPLLILGSYVGAIFGTISIEYFQVDASFMNNFIILSMAGLFTGIVRAPITGIILVTEMTGGFSHMLSLAVVSMVAYVVANLCHSEPIYDSLLSRILAGKKVKEVKVNKKKMLLEFTVANGSPLIHQQIKDVDWEDCLVVEIRRGEEEIITKGTTTIKRGDQLVFLVESNGLSNYHKKLSKLCSGEEA